MIGFFLLSLALAAVDNPGPMERIELKVAGRVVDVVAADVNGDGQNDVLVFWRQGFPPRAHSRVSVFLAKGGRIQSKPSQVLTLSAQTVAYDVGDIGSDARADVVLLTSDGVWAHQGQEDGSLTAEPTQVIKVMTVAAFPHEDHVPRISMLIQLDGKEHRGLLIPTVPIGPLTLYEYSSERGWYLRQVLRVPTRSNIYTSAEDFRSVRDYGASIRLTYPRWSVADQDGDGHADLLFFCRDTLAVFRRKPDGSFPPRPDLYQRFGLIASNERIKRSLIVRGEAGDINGDGRADLLFIKTVGGISNMKNELRLYVADARGGYPAMPALVSKRDGWGSSARLTDVNGDGIADLVRPHVEMGLTTLIGMMLRGKLEVNFEIYLSRDGRIGTRPSMELDSPLNINFRSDQELTGPYPIFSQDFNADGYRDLLMGRAGGGSGDRPDSLDIRLGNGKARFADDPAWSLDLQGTRFVHPFRVKPQDRPGLLIRFSLVEKMRGDVWVLHNRGAWRK